MTAEPAPVDPMQVLLDQLTQAGQEVLSTGAALSDAVTAHDKATAELANARDRSAAAQANLQNAQANLIAAASQP